MHIPTTPSTSPSLLIHSPWFVPPPFCFSFSTNLQPVVCVPFPLALASPSPLISYSWFVQPPSAFLSLQPAPLLCLSSADPAFLPWLLLPTPGSLRCPWAFSRCPSSPAVCCLLFFSLWGFLSVLPLSLASAAYAGITLGPSPTSCLTLQRIHLFPPVLPL